MNTRNIILHNAESIRSIDSTPRTFLSVSRAKLEALKTNLIDSIAAEFSDLEKSIVRRAVEDVDALASATGFALLLLPALAEEKVREARAWHRRQQSIFQRSR